MKFEIVKNFNYLTQEELQSILIDNGDGSFKSFPVDESNSEFVAFVKANPDWNK